MSTILDALRKSEQERKQQRLPTLMDSPLPKESSKWPWLVVALCLLVLTGGLVYVLMQLPSESGQGVRNGEANEFIANQEVTSQSSIQESTLDLSVISYSEDAQQRFVMIDEKLLREGEYLSAGTRVLEIRADSVLIDKRGERLELRP